MCKYLLCEENDMGCRRSFSWPMGFKGGVWKIKRKKTSRPCVCVLCVFFIVLFFSLPTSLLCFLGQRGTITENKYDNLELLVHCLSMTYDPVMGLDNTQAFYTIRKRKSTFLSQSAIVILSRCLCTTANIRSIRFPYMHFVYFS